MMTSTGFTGMADMLSALLLALAALETYWVCTTAWGGRRRLRSHTPGPVPAQKFYTASLLNPAGSSELESRGAEGVQVRGRQARAVRNMGLFDGIGEVFKSDEAEAIEAARETPFDRWLGIDTKRTNVKTDVDFVDSMSDRNYVKVNLPKPMGVVFEENDPTVGGVFAASIMPDMAAHKTGKLQAGDQLVAVGDQDVLGLLFDDALSYITSTEGNVDLVFFRGGLQNLYGPRAPTTQWFSEFMERIKAGSAALV